MAAAVRRGRVESVRHEHVGLALGIRFDVSERLVEHADNRRGLCIDDQAAPDDIRVAAVAALPERVPENNGARTAGAILFVGERPAERESRAERREESLRDVDAAEPLRLAGRVEHVKNPMNPCAPIRANVLASRGKSRKSAGDRPRSPARDRTQRCAPARRGRNTGGRSSTARITLNMALLAPSPSASVSTAVAVKAGRAARGAACRSVGGKHGRG